MNSRLSWLLLATHVPPTGSRGGMVRYVMELAGELAIRPDVELHVLVTPPSRPLMTELLGDPGRVWTVPALPTPVRSLLERPGYGVPALRRGFDVVHGTKHLVPSAGRGLRLLTVHDMLPMDRPQDFGLLKRRALVGPYRASIRASDVLVTVSRATRDRLLAEEPDVAAKTVPVPLALSSSLATAAPVPVPALEGRRFALVVGDASPRKNLSLLVDAWEHVVAADPGAVLVTVGPHGWGVDDRGVRWNRMVQGGSVLALQQVDDGVLRWCYEHAQVVACPSLLEGFGLPAVEALHFGAPLLTSEDPALVEASGAAAAHLDVRDPGAWVQELVDRLAAPRAHRPRERTRTWGDVAEETVRAVQDRIRP